MGSNTITKSAKERVYLWRINNPDKYKAQQKRYRDKLDPDVLATFYRERNYRSKYGISIKIYDEMLENQNNVCAICKNTNGKLRLAVDHCHISGKVRKLLCTKCNLTVEHLENANTDIQKYLDYIKEHQSEE